MSTLPTFEERMQPHWRKACALIHRLGGAMTAREFARHTWRFRQVGKSVLQGMVDREMGRWEDAPRGPKGGRPTRRFVLAADISADGRRVSSLDASSSSPE